MALFGFDETCAIELWDSPSLLKHLELGSQRNALRTLTVYTDREDEAFLTAVDNVAVAGGVRLRAPAERAKSSGFLMGSVVDLDGRPLCYGGYSIVRTNFCRRLPMMSPA